MAYTRKNFLKKVLRVQEVYLRFKEQGITNEEIYKRYIAPHFFISRSTFYEYLAIPATKELKEICNESVNQKKLNRYEKDF
ncbi:hypothetical protein ACT29H_01760 [Thermophagus sp. OGC60D27]|uniref:hypothetical protein n=1 Tax=Thermophagus sp. OGC60D27 TaxID=3458415 RepID=UPI0040381A80